jgi:hypothetical protein
VESEPHIVPNLRERAAAAAASRSRLRWLPGTLYRRRLSACSAAKRSKNACTGPLESTSVSDIATLTVGSATSVKVLPGILQRGHHYVARIQATTAALVPRGRSNVLTGMISVSP